MRPVVVGIAGGSASGKSSLARRLQEFLGDRCLLLLHDRYYHPLPDHLRERPLDYNFDHPEALETERLITHLRSLRSGQPVRLPIYDFARHDRAGHTDPVAPREVILVEGILVLADDGLRDEFDHRIFVSTPSDVRLVRRIRRDVAERGREVDEVLAQYERTVRPMHRRYVEPSREHADLVVDGTQPLQRSVAQVLGLLEC